MDPTRVQMQDIFSLCRKDEWNRILQMVQENPAITTAFMIMDNHIATTILHQAITSKANTQIRARVIQTILDMAPEATKIKNGYGSLPLHVISQRNLKMDSQTKEHLIRLLMKVSPNAIVEEGGISRRTPLHIAFTDYISPDLARTLIEKGKRATFMKDRKGWLPIHVAVSRHCSPEKLRMLLKANPDSLHALTKNGQSLLHLAKKTATKSHPNFALIAELEKHLGCIQPSSKKKKITVEEKETNELLYYQQGTMIGCQPTRKRKAEAAELLLNFSKQPCYHAPLPVGSVVGYPSQKKTISSPSVVMNNRQMLPYPLPQHWHYNNFAPHSNRVYYEGIGETAQV